ncbi:hypothetical protein [Hoeflea sp.]|uniref:hypothetical protein n=1 Tax=Hoeflea sp. TaxID=1940281 RepID=UPI003B5235B6
MQTIIRHTFTPEEVAAALIDNVPKAQEIQVRFADGYVEIDIVGPITAAAETAKEEPQDEVAQSDAEKTESAPETVADQKKKPLGKNAKTVLEHCALGGFQVYLDVEGEAAALERVLFTCNASSIESFDNNKTAMAAFKDICAEFQLWCGGAD